MQLLVALLQHSTTIFIVVPIVLLIASLTGYLQKPTTLTAVILQTHSEILLLVVTQQTILNRLSFIDARL